MTITIRAATAADATVLSTLAAATFPLACPPHTTDEAKADFIAQHLSVTSFAAYLADTQRYLMLAEADGVAAGYVMLVKGEPYDADVAAVLTRRPTIELSKCYVLPQFHKAGVAALLMQASVDYARAQGVAAVWLGVNEENARANRFYEKSGFAIVGRKKFLVGGRYEEDFVRERVL